MQKNINALEYAKAIYELAIERNKQELIYEQALELSHLFSEDENFLFWFKSLSIDIKEKKDFINKNICLYVDEILKNFLYYLIDRGDEQLIKRILLIVDKFLRNYLNILRVKITTPFPINENDLENLKQAISKKTGKNIRADVYLDPNLIGGIRIEYESKYFDNSIQGKLTDIKNKLKGEIKNE